MSARRAGAVKVEVFCICEKAGLQDDGSLTIVGIYNRLYASRFPMDLQGFVVAVRIHCDPDEDRKHWLSVIVTDPDANVIATKGPVELRVKTEEHLTHAWIPWVGILGPIRLDGPSEYHLILKVDKQELANTVLFVALKPTAAATDASE